MAAARRAATSILTPGPGSSSRDALDYRCPWSRPASFDTRRRKALVLDRCPSRRTRPCRPCPARCRLFDAKLDRAAFDGLDGGGSRPSSPCRPWGSAVRPRGPSTLTRRPTSGINVRSRDAAVEVDRPALHDRHAPRRRRHRAPAALLQPPWRRGRTPARAHAPVPFGKVDHAAHIWSACLGRRRDSSRFRPIRRTWLGPLAHQLDASLSG